MITVGAFEAKTHLSKLIDSVAGGEEVTITKHGVPVARLVPIGNNNANGADAIARLRSLAVGTTLGETSIAEMIAEGRKY